MGIFCRGLVGEDVFVGRVGRGGDYFEYGYRGGLLYDVDGVVRGLLCRYYGSWYVGDGFGY